MKYSKYSGSGKGLGERGRRRNKKAPITGIELESLIAKNKLENEVIDQILIQDKK